MKCLKWQMNIPWMNIIIIITILYLSPLVQSETIRYSINVQPGFGKETWHPKLSRNYLNDGSFELVDDRKAKYQTSLIQIQNKFLGATTPKLQCECRFVKDTSIPDVAPISVHKETKVESEVISDEKVKGNNDKKSTENNCESDLVKTLTKRLEENNALMNQINNYLGNEPQGNRKNNIQANQPMQTIQQIQQPSMQTMQPISQPISQPIMQPMQQPMQPVQPMQGIQPVFAIQQPTLVPAAPITYQYPYITSTIPPTLNPYPLFAQMPYSNTYVR